MTELSKTYTWRFGWFFHLECAPVDSELDAQAKALGKKPDDMSEGHWALEQGKRKVGIMLQTYGDNAPSGVCVKCPMGRVSDVEAVAG